MSKRNYKFIDLEHDWTNKPVLTLDLKPKLRKNFRRTANKFASISKGTVFSIQGDEIKVSLPENVFNNNNLVRFLSEITTMDISPIKSVKIKDLYIPKNIFKNFPGPKYGVKGVKKNMKTKKRMFSGKEIKYESEGLKNYSDKVRKYWMKADFLKDTDYIKNIEEFERKVSKVLEIKDQVERSTSDKKAFLFNVFSTQEDMIKRAEIVRQHGGKYVTINGLNSLSRLRKQNLKIFIHSDKALHTVIDKQNKGLSMTVLGNLSRMLGADIVNIGIERKSYKKVKDFEFFLKDVNHVENSLKSKIGRLKPSLVSLSGSFDEKSLLALKNTIRRDFILENK